ncbi:MAG: TRAP transporter small permease [Betaproteobacteria bacterium]
MRDALDRLSLAFALTGGVLLCVLVLAVTASILGRWLLDTPLLGDVELMQLGCAVAIAAALPYCQWRSSHVMVNVFTLHATPYTQRTLDRAGALAAAAIYLLLAWRAGVAVADLRASGETTMLLAMPLWWAYVALVPGLLLATANALYSAVTGPPR